MILTLDLAKENFNSLIKYKQGDTRTLTFNVVNDGIAFDLTGYTVVLNAINSKSEGFTQSTDITVNNDKVVVKLNKDFTKVAGKVVVEVVISKGEEQFTTFTFAIMVRAGVLQGAKNIVNGVAQDVIESLGFKVVEATKVLNDTEKLITSGGALDKSEFLPFTNKVETAIKDLTALDIKVVKTREHTIGTTYTVASIPFANSDGSFNKVKKQFASGGHNATELPRNMILREKAILGINASALQGSAGAGGKIIGHQIKDGVAISDTHITGPYWTLGVKADGTIKSYKNSTSTVQTLLNDGVVNSFGFSIPIIQNGVEVSEIIYNDYTAYNQRHPRQVIGQKADKTLIILTSEGRRDNEAGFTLPECAKILLQLGCVEAYNLDGGGSTQTVYNGVLVNTPVDLNLGSVERATPDIMYFTKEITPQRQDQENRVLTLLERKVVDLINEIKIFGTNFIKQNIVKTIIHSPHDTFNTIGMESKGYDDVNTGIELSTNGKVWGKLGMLKSALRYAKYDDVTGVGTQIFRVRDNGEIDTTKGTIADCFKDTQLVTDVRNITASGFYWTNANSLNAPFGGTLPAMILAIGSRQGGYLRLEAWSWRTNQKAWCFLDANGWSAWTSY